MEKFTVDLDKVLDEFEFNEEQAFHQENFKNEDLPAKRYQKPHFQPINMADADFSPSVETTIPFLPHNRKHSQDSTNSSTASDNVSFICKFAEINHTPISDIIEAPVVNNFQSVKGNFDKDEKKSPKIEDFIPFSTVGSIESIKSIEAEQKMNQGQVKEVEKREVESEKEMKEDQLGKEIKEVESERGKKEEESERGKKEEESEKEKMEEVSEKGKKEGESEKKKKEGESEKKKKEEELEKERKEEQSSEKEKKEGELEEVKKEEKSEKEEQVVDVGEEEEEETTTTTTTEDDEEEVEEIDFEDEENIEEKTVEVNEGKGVKMENEIKGETVKTEEKVINESELRKERDRDEEKCKTYSINTDVSEKSVENLMSKIEESQRKPDLIGNEPVVGKDADETLKLPDLTDVNSDHNQENGGEKNAVLNLQKTEKDSDGNTSEVKLTEKNSASESDTSSSLTDEDSEAEKSEKSKSTAFIEPIRFQSQNNISDEDLYRYLEELEAEEKRKSAESDSKQARPDFLDLNEKNEPERFGSPGLTPLPRDVKSFESEGSREEGKETPDLKDNEEKSEPVGGKTEQSQENEVVSGVSQNARAGIEGLTIDERRLGKVSPFWIPDHFASSCMDCDIKFTVIKRRHHCRACGRILCSKCSGMRASLEYLKNQEERVCNSCFLTLAKVMMYELEYEEEPAPQTVKKPNPNNPMEYCSTVPPPLQVSSTSSLSPPSVLVPVGVLKREGTAKVKENPKQVMFSDGIRPGGDLTDLDGSADQRRAFKRAGRINKRAGTPPGNALLSLARMLPPIDPKTQSFIPEKGLPPVCTVNKGETIYEENWPHDKLMERLKDKSQPALTFAVNRHLIVSLKIVKKDCCMNKTCWVFCTKGMENVGQDEILFLLTLKDENDDVIPKDVFLQLNSIYLEAAKGNTIGELGCWSILDSNFLDSPQHGGLLFIRPTFQCLNHLDPPSPPYLVGILIHRSEVPWARVFPIRLMLRLGAEFRYYPAPLVSVRFREPVYHDVGHTIIKLLADFRNLSYTLPSVRGLRIHIQAKEASILIPKNRYDQIIRALNNSNEPVLALAGNFSKEADAHLVCIQSKGEEITYKTQTININDKPRKVTGASFVVLNGALKSTSGLSAKSSFVEDGLLVQVPNEMMVVLRNKLRNMEDWSIKCGPVENDFSEEIVKIIWCDDDKNFNVGVKSVIDEMALDGIPSNRTHNFIDCMGTTKFIRWTHVYIIKCEDGATSAKIGDPIQINKLSENIARATCVALKKFLDLLAASSLMTIAVRATIDQDNVGYEAGSNGEKLPPIYMNSLDNELIPVLHQAASLNDSVAVLELVFHILDQ